MTVEKVTLAKVYPTTCHVEKDIVGTVHIKLQHEGMRAHTLVQIHYDHRYTSNGHQWELTNEIVRLLGFDPKEVIK